jgi:hypothetical protein
MTTTTAAPTLSDEQLVEVLALVKKADSVELKLTVPADAQRATLSALDLDPLDAQIRQVFFFDTPELALNAGGLVVRARRVQGKGDDTVVKLRPVVPEKLSPELRASAAFGIEVDAMPGGFVCSGSMKGVPSKARVKEAVGGGVPARKLFSKEQRALYAEHAPEGLAIDDLAVLGPIFVLKVKKFPTELGRKLVGEMWLYPDGSRLLELSTKCAPGEAFEVSAETRAFLSERGIEMGGEQETKTRKALEFFAGQLRKSA